MKPYTTISSRQNGKKRGRYFREPRVGPTHAQGGPQSAEISPAWSNRAQKSSADSQGACESIARVRMAKSEVKIALSFHELSAIT